jgi:hypothetical protein
VATVKLRVYRQLAARRIYFNVCFMIGRLVYMEILSFGFFCKYMHVATRDDTDVSKHVTVTITGAHTTAIFKICLFFLASVPQ